MLGGDHPAKAHPVVGQHTSVQVGISRQLLSGVRRSYVDLAKEPSEDLVVGAWGRRRLDLRPGMTGLWQVLGRNDIPFDEMLNLDYRYVTTWSAPGDLALIFRTFPTLARSTDLVR